jgi:hypothetical protein
MDGSLLERGMKYGLCPSCQNPLNEAAITTDVGSVFVKSCPICDPEAHRA